MIVPDLPRFLVNYAHAQTVDTRPLFRGGVWPGDEASTVAKVCLRLLRSIVLVHILPRV